MIDDAVVFAREWLTPQSGATYTLGDGTLEMLARAVLSLAAERDRLREALEEALDRWPSESVDASYERLRKLVGG